MYDIYGMREQGDREIGQTVSERIETDRDKEIAIDRGYDR